MTFNTGNPVGSTDARDLYDNAQNFDKLSVGPERSYPDRRGVSRKSWAGMEADFTAFLAASGFEPDVLEYVDGTPLTVDRPTQLIERASTPGILYAIKLPSSFPVALSGSWATDEAKLVIRVDDSLRQELAAPGGWQRIGLAYGKLPDAISWLTPQMFGATAASGDDDTEALQAALNIDSAVRVPAGKYGVNGGLVWDYNALRLTGDGISSWIEGINGHTITVNAGQADGVIEHLWIDQKDLSVTPTYDVMHLNAGEMHVNFVDVDWADRYGIYVGGYRTSVLQYASQACREASIFVDANAYAFSGTDITFENAGQGVPGNGIVQNGQRAVIKGVSAFNTGGYVWNLAGNYNAGVCAAAVFSNAAGAGTKSEDAYRVSGSFNAEAAVIARGTVGVAHHVTGSANSLHALVSDNSTKEALRVTGSNNDISGRFNAAGQDGASNSITLTNTAARTNLSANTSAPAGTGRALSVASIENCITGVYDGTVIIDGGDSNYSIRCDSLILNSGSSNAVQAAITGVLPIAAEIKSSSHALALTVNNAETNIAVVSGSSNIGYIRGSGASGDGIIISGNDNELQLRASGSGGNDLVISGSWNDLHINCAGNVRITGTATKNMITGVIRGNLTLENGSQGNRFFGKVLGTVTNSGSSNTVDATA
ncbi:hypothetical protein [Stutzerimonas nitrititolerans]|uniref:hypothetical protein n=1 Tax=Stutzerimonas nitrititolerans TaxID=2482751 RepID=UPI002898C98E|nr:hypothetical protein [Stutzerimonas nitrititolerans]